MSSEVQIGTWVRHETARMALGELLPKLNAASIAPLLVKGIVTARTLYADVSERPISDVDLRVRPEELPRVREALKDVREIEGASDQWGHASYVHRDLLIEFESTLGPRGLVATSVDKLYQRATLSTEWFGANYRLPELHDHTLLLIVNAFKDKLYDCPPWSIQDLLRIVAVPGFQITELQARLREAKFESAAWVTADWLARTHASTKWAEIRDALPAPRAGMARRMKKVADQKKLTFRARIDARIASDDPLRRAEALAFTALGVWRGRRKKA